MFSAMSVSRVCCILHRAQQCRHASLVSCVGAVQPFRRIRLKLICQMHDILVIVFRLGVTAPVLAISSAVATHFV